MCAQIYSIIFDTFDTLFKLGVKKSIKSAFKLVQFMTHISVYTEELWDPILQTLVYVCI